MVLTIGQIRFSIFVFLMVASSEGLFAQAPANENITDAAKKQYDFLYNYKRNPENCLIIGQNLGHRDQMLDYYEEYIEKIQTNAGVKPMLIGGDLGLIGELDVNAVGQLLQTHTEAGGMVTLSWQSINPFNGTYFIYEGEPFRDFNRLMTSGDPLNASWLVELDEVAEILGAFQDRGVTVLWRPFSDMNGNWYWWGSDANRDEKEFQKLWQFTYNYLTHVKGLNNLLWVFSVNRSTVLADESGEWLKGKNYYPGKDYVDVVGITVFDDELKIQDRHDYTDLKAFNKPLALTVCGPRQETAHGDFNYDTFFDIIQEKYPEIAYANIMHSFDEYKLALTDNQSYVDFILHGCIVNLTEANYDEEWGNSDDSVLENLEIMPNPAFDVFYLSSSTIIEGPVTVELINAFGQVAFEQTFDQVYYQEVLVANVPKGGYLLRISVADDSILKKLILQ